MHRVRSLAIYALSLLGACNPPRPSDPSPLSNAAGPLPLSADADETPAAGTLSGSSDLERAPASVTPGSDPMIDPSSAKTFLVWTRNERGVAVTHHLDKAGEELERLPGVHVGTRTGTWQWREEEVALPTRACEHEDENGKILRGDPPAPGRATKVTLVPTVTSKSEQRLVDPSAATTAPAPDPEVAVAGAATAGGSSAEESFVNEEDGDLFQGAEDLRHTVTLSGSIGPYLFFEESTYAYTCGAHGNTSVSARIWNVAAAQPEPMPADIGPLEGPVARAAEELTETEEDSFPVTNDNIEVTAMLPRYEERGKLRLGLQFTAPTCYACTRGGSSSYTKSTVVDAEALPKAFARYAATPEPVRAWAASHPEERVGGWSALGW